MDWSANHCRPIAQQSAEIVTARAMHQSTPESIDRSLMRQLLERFQNRDIVSEMDDRVFTSSLQSGMSSILCLFGALITLFDC